MILPYVIKYYDKYYYDRDYNYYYDKDYEIIGISDVACTTQSETVELNGNIVPKGIRLLADFDPCKIYHGGVTLNLPDTPDIKLVVMHIDKTGNNHAGTLINPTKIQTINNNQALYTIQLDEKMTGLNPITGKSSTITDINGLSLYNDGDKDITFDTGNIAALTAIFTGYH